MGRLLLSAACPDTGFKDGDGEAAEMPLKAEGCSTSLPDSGRGPAAFPGQSAGSLLRAAPRCSPGALRPARVFASPADKCGDTIKILSPGYLTSPGYPQSYHPSQKCEWLIQAPEPYQRIMINFNPHFDLEDRDCKWVSERARAAERSATATPAGGCACVGVFGAVFVCVCVLKILLPLSGVCELRPSCARPVRPEREAVVMRGVRVRLCWGTVCWPACFCKPLVLSLSLKKEFLFFWYPPRLQRTHGRDRPFIKCQIFLTRN